MSIERTIRWALLAGWVSLQVTFSNQAQPSLQTTQTAPGVVELRWSAADSSDFELETAATVGAGELWTPVRPGGGREGDWFVLRVPRSDGTAFFRLRQVVPHPAPPVIELRVEELGLGRLGPLVVRPDGSRAYAGRVFSQQRSRQNIACIALDTARGQATGVTFVEDSPTALPLEGRSSVGRMALHPGGRKLYWLIHQDFPFEGARAPVAEVVVVDLDEAGDPVGRPRAFPCPNPLPYLDALAVLPSRQSLYVGGYGSGALYRFPLDPTGEPTLPAEAHELGVTDLYEIRPVAGDDRLLLGFGESNVGSLDLDPSGAPRSGTLRVRTFAANPAAPYMRFVVAGQGLFRSGLDYRLLRVPIPVQGWGLDADGLPPASTPVVFAGLDSLAGPVAAGADRLLIAQRETFLDTFTGENAVRGFAINAVPLGADGLPGGSVSTVARVFRRDPQVMAVTAGGTPVVATQPAEAGARGFFPGDEVRGFHLRVTPLEVVASAPDLVLGYTFHVASPAGEFPVPALQAIGEAGVVDIDSVHQVGVVPISVLAGTDGQLLLQVRAEPRLSEPEASVAVLASRWRIEVYDGPVEGRIPTKVMEESVDGDRLAFLLPGYGLMPDGSRANRIQTLGQHVAELAGLAQRVAIPPEDRPSRFMVSAFHNIGIQPSLQQLTNAAVALSSLGFNTFISQGWSGLDSNIVNQVFNASGLTGRGMAFYAPLLGHEDMPESADLTYFDFYLRDHNDALTNWLDRSIQAFERSGAVGREMLGDLKIADEPGWYYPWKHQDVRTQAVLRNRFTDYLASKGLTPADVGAGAWSEVAPQGGGFLLSPNPSLAQRRLFYWTARFYAESAVEGMARTRAAAETIVGHPLTVSVNWNNFLNEWYTPSPNAPLYNNPDKGPDAAVGSMDWFYAGRTSAHTLWSEDWFTDQDAQEWSFRADLLRSAAMEGSSSFGAYIIGQMTGTRPWGTAQKLLALVGSGGKAVEMYTWGPGVFTGDAWSSMTNVYATSARAFQLLGRSERLLYPGVPERGSVAVVLPSASRLWDASSEWPLYLEEARFQHYALVHAGYSVDLLDEYALESNAFADRGYQVIYLNGPNLPVVAVANLARWVQAGGCLVTTPGAAVADLYNEPNDQMTQFAGIASRQAVRLISPQPLIPVGECVVDDPGVPPLRIPVMTPRVPLELTAATQIAGWGDGGTAIARRGAGTGQVISYGFFPGQQYWITADRDDSLGSPFYFTRLPRGWRKDQRDVVVMPARLAGARRQAVTSHELVEARVLRSPAGVAVTLLNWTDAPIPGFSVSLPDVTEWTRVSTATGVPVTAREEGGLRTFDLPLGAVDVLMLERP